MKQITLDVEDIIYDEVYQQGYSHGAKEANLIRDRMDNRRGSSIIFLLFIGFIFGIIIAYIAYSMK